MTAPGDGDPRDAVDLIDEAVAGITDAEIEERLRSTLDRAGYGRKDGAMGELDAAARAAGFEVEARVLLVHGADALLELPGEREPVRWPAAEVAAGAGVSAEEVPGLRVLVTVRESSEAGRVLSGFGLAEG